ncbi:hypothetical protein DSECCO2_661260 [anaerobic digester metagenome]
MRVDFRVKPCGFTDFLRSKQPYFTKRVTQERSKFLALSVVEHFHEGSELNAFRMGQDFFRRLRHFIRSPFKNFFVAIRVDKSYPGMGVYNCSCFKVFVNGLPSPFYICSPHLKLNLRPMRAEPVPDLVYKDIRFICAGVDHELIIMCRSSRAGF